jgi:outer membrane lipoprotein-sorting protein
MYRTCTLLLAGFALAGWTLTARAQDDECRAIVLKAMEAHGGKKLLNKYPAVQAKFKGDFDLMGMSVKMNGEVSFNFPDKMRNVVDLNINNNSIQVIQVYDGKNFWVSAMGNTQEIKDEKVIEETKESMYVEKVAGLVDIDDKAYKLSALGEAKVNGKAAVGVRVSRDGRRDVNLYFDKATHVLLKYEFRGKHPIDMMEGTQEKILSNYKDVMGIKTAYRIDINIDGKKLMELEITDVQLAERLDDTHFAKP